MLKVPVKVTEKTADIKQHCRHEYQSAQIPFLVQVQSRPYKTPDLPEYVWKGKDGSAHDSDLQV